MPQRRLRRTLDQHTCSGRERDWDKYSRYHRLVIIGITHLRSPLDRDLKLIRNHIHEKIGCLETTCMQASQ